MTGWIILGVAVVGFVACYRLAYQFIDEHEGSDRDDAGDRAMLVMMAVLISIVWPLVLTGWAVWLVATPTTARERRRQVRELEQRRADLRREITQAERELGIKREDRP